MDSKNHAPILLAIDGEPHTDPAVEWAIELARQRDIELVAVHVNDPYLKQFSNDLYAQGREEYLDHVEACNASDASHAVAAFSTIAKKAAIRSRTKTLRGPLAKEIIKELDAHPYELVVTGRRKREGLDAIRSPDLPAKLMSARVPIPILVIPSDKKT